MSLSKFRPNEFSMALESRMQDAARECLPFVNFDNAECMSLLKIYYRLTSNEPMDRLQFRSIMYVALKITDSFMLDRIFAMADKDDNGIISPCEWLLVLSTMLRGSLDELIEFTYNIYDINGDRQVSSDELFMLYAGSFKYMKLSGMDVAEATECLKDLVFILIRKLDVDQDGIISFFDFKIAVENDPLLLQCGGVCLPNSDALRAFQSTYTWDYNNKSREYYQTPSALRAGQLAYESKKRKITHRKISDVDIPPPTVSRKSVFLDVHATNTFYITTKPSPAVMSEQTADSNET